MQTLIDPFNRSISYLRVSVTDRCDFRCVYCMTENMKFLPKKELLTLEELDFLCSSFINMGVEKLRITGGEPLVRRNIMSFFQSISRHLDDQKLKELTLTTNGSQLKKFAKELYGVGVRRVNISLDTLDDAKFAKVTRWGRLSWCNERGMDLTWIEVMPMGDLESEERIGQYWSLNELRQTLEQEYTLTDMTERSGGPARYVKVNETGQKIGFITPLSHNFCESCNRVRLTCTGELYMCLGQEDKADLRRPLREKPNDEGHLRKAIEAAIAKKPKGHDFDYTRQEVQGQMTRHMSHTGG